MARILALLLLCFPLVALAATDRCSGLIPADAATAATRHLPGFRFPRSTDNLDEDVVFNLSEHGSGCLGIAIGDFDGNGEKDYLLGLSSLKDQAAAIVVVLHVDNRWVTERLDGWPNGRSRLFVEAGRSGKYVRTEALEGPPSETGEVLQLNCKHKVAIFGATESSAVAYCHQKFGWQHVWISD